MDAEVAARHNLGMDAVTVPRVRRRPAVRWGWRIAFIALIAIAVLRWFVLPYVWAWNANSTHLASVTSLTEGFGRMASPSGGPIRKWDRPMVVHLNGPAAAAQHELVEDIVRYLGAFTGVDARVTAARDGGENVVVEFVGPAAYGEGVARQGGTAQEVEFVIERSICYVAPRAREGATRPDYLVVIPVSLRDVDTQLCLMHEFLHVFGFPGHAGLPSMLNFRRGRTEYSINDLILLRALYDPRIKPGMPGDQAIRLAGTIIPDLVAQVAAAADPMTVLLPP